jgi:4-diphosphocytidyl-2-C-methyl-D-erythritol kinase
MRLIAPAKVNLSLDVGPLRADGFHAYASVATAIGLADSVNVEVVATPGVSVVTSSGLEDTLAAAGARSVCDALGQTPGLVLSVDKRIPVGAGLGGGSADAAAGMYAAATILGVDPAALLDIAASVGTDVPFCLVGGCARLSGRGEIVEPLPPLPPFGLLVVVPPVQLSTAAVFAAFDEVGAGAAPPPADEWLAELLPGCSFKNDLQAAACAVEPSLPSWQARLEAAADRPLRMTGSGSAFWCAAPSPAELEDAAAAARATGAAAFVTTPVPHGVRSVA